MLKHRFFISLLSTILLYVSVGILFVYLLHKTIITEEKPQKKIINFTLSEYKPEVIPPVEIPAVENLEAPIKEPEPKEKEPIEEVMSEPIVKKVVSTPIVKKTVKKKAIKKKRIKKKIIKKKSVKKSVKKRKKIAKKPIRKPVRKNKVTRKQTSPAKKNRFLNVLRAKINKAKTYPRIAQRRGMQGSVKVRFTILRNGRVSNIHITGKKVFHKSARKAVNSAFPIHTKNVPLSLPTTVNLTLRYQIR